MQGSGCLLQSGDETPERTSVRSVQERWFESPHAQLHGTGGAQLERLKTGDDEIGRWMDSRWRERRFVESHGSQVMAYPFEELNSLPQGELSGFLYQH